METGIERYTKKNLTLNPKIRTFGILGLLAISKASSRKQFWLLRRFLKAREANRFLGCSGELGFVPVITSPKESMYTNNPYIGPQSL